MNKEAFEICFRRYYPRLVAFASRFLGSTEDAKDIVQDCFVKFWERFDSYSNNSEGAILYTMVRNRCINILKHKITRMRYKFPRNTSDQSLEMMFNLDFRPQESDAVLIYEELNSWLEQEISKLPPKNAEVFRMSRIQGLKNTEIAHILNISDAAVHKHLSKATAKLEKDLNNLDKKG